MKETKKLAFAGVMAALSAALLFAAALAPTMTLGLAAAAGLFVAAVYMECGLKFAALTYLSCSALSLLLSPDKQAAFLYAFFFGLYPIFKAFAESRRTELLEYGAKLLFCNAGLAAIYFSIRAFAALPDLSAFKMPVWVLIVILNGAFFLYDYGFSRLIILYRRRRGRK